VTLVAAGLIVVLLAGITIRLAIESAGTWARFGLGFLGGTTWDVVNGVYGALPFVAGTVESSLLALIIAVPLSLLTAIFLAELAPRWLSVPLTFLVELLAAIPSVVVGLWGVFVLSPFLRDTVEKWLVGALGFIPIFSGPAFGIGLFSAQREAMLALGATRWETTRRAVLPYARSGIVGAVILGLGRALGETMAVTMVIGNKDIVPTRVFDQAQTIASKIATTFNEAQVGIQTQSLIALGLVLLAITLALNVIARLLVRQVAGDGGGLASGG